MGKGPRLLMSQRNTALLLERARVRTEGGRVVYDKADEKREKTFNVPFANLAILFLGQGTSLTQDAARLLSEEGVYVAFTGTDGTPLHYGALTNYQVTKYFQRMFPISTSPSQSLEVARMAMQRRVDLIDQLTGKVREATGVRVDEAQLRGLCGQLRDYLPQIESHEKMIGVEGMLTKRLYALYADALGVSDFTRVHGAGDRSSPAALANSRLDQGNYLAYGVAGASLWTLGIPASLSFFHGKTRAGGLVFDMADIFKDAIVLPCAFAQHASERDFRNTLTDLLQDLGALEICFVFLKTILDKD